MSSDFLLKVVVVAVWINVNVVGHVNKVALRRAGLVLRWVTIQLLSVGV